VQHLQQKRSSSKRGAAARGAAEADVAVAAVCGWLMCIGKAGEMVAYCVDTVIWKLSQLLLLLLV
jgi:hypothetical protein